MDAAPGMNAHIDDLLAVVTTGIRLRFAPPS